MQHITQRDGKIQYMVVKTPNSQKEKKMLYAAICVFKTGNAEKPVKVAGSAKGQVLFNFPVRFHTT